MQKFYSMCWIRIMQRLIKGTEVVLKRDPVHDLKFVLKPTLSERSNAIKILVLGLEFSLQLNNPILNHWFLDWNSLFLDWHLWLYTMRVLGLTTSNCNSITRCEKCNYLLVCLVWHVNGIYFFLMTVLFLWQVEERALKKVRRKIKNKV